MAFPVRRIEPEQLLGNHQGQNPVAEKFQALVVIVLVVGAAVGQRMAQQNLVLELIAKALRDLVMQGLRKADQNPQAPREGSGNGPSEFRKATSKLPKGLCRAKSKRR